LANILIHVTHDRLTMAGGVLNSSDKNHATVVIFGAIRSYFWLGNCSQAGV
jgi:hypothetical protein